MIKNGQCAIPGLDDFPDMLNFVKNAIKPGIHGKTLLSKWEENCVNDVQEPAPDRRRVSKEEKNFFHTTFMNSLSFYELQRAEI